MQTMIEWTKMPRGTYRYTENGLTADLWQVSGRGWLWAVYQGEYPVHGHEGIAQHTIDQACELALQHMAI